MEIAGGLRLAAPGGYGPISGKGAGEIYEFRASKLEQKGARRPSNNISWDPPSRISPGTCAGNAHWLVATYADKVSDKPPWLLESICGV